jgi:integrase
MAVFKHYNDYKGKRKESRFFYGEYRDAVGVLRRVKLAQDKKTSELLLAEFARRSVLEAAGLYRPAEAQEKRPLCEHLDDFISHLRAAERTGQHINERRNQLMLIFANCQFRYIKDITVSKMQGFISEFRQRGRASQTANSYIVSLKHFCHWLQREGRIQNDPLLNLGKLNAAMDRRHIRRALDDNEKRALLSAAQSGAPFRGMSGEHRALLYRLALTSGLRSGELASLTWQDFELENGTPTVTVAAANSKHRRQDRLPLREDVATALRAWKADHADDDKVFPLPNDKAAEMMQVDLQSAGIPYVDEAGKFADFHSLRHTFISDLAKAGVHPKVCQSLARHSTFELTFNTYTHLDTKELRAAVETLVFDKDFEADAPDTLALQASKFKASGASNGFQDRRIQPLCQPSTLLICARAKRSASAISLLPR